VEEAGWRAGSPTRCLNDDPDPPSMRNRPRTIRVATDWQGRAIQERFGPIHGRWRDVVTGRRGPEVGDKVLAGPSEHGPGTWHKTELLYARGGWRVEGGSRLGIRTDLALLESNRRSHLPNWVSVHKRSPNWSVSANSGQILCGGRRPSSTWPPATRQGRRLRYGDRPWRFGRWVFAGVASVVAGPSGIGAKDPHDASRDGPPPKTAPNPATRRGCCFVVTWTYGLAIPNGVLRAR